jgi:hypothetical protein
MTKYLKDTLYKKSFRSLKQHVGHGVWLLLDASWQAIHYGGCWISYSFGIFPRTDGLLFCGLE